ncbi:hypothetical protein ACQJ71_03795 [Helicobacter pylori]
MAHFIFSVAVVLLWLVGLFLLLCVVSSSFRRMIGEFFEGCFTAVFIVGICIAFPPFTIAVIIYLIWTCCDDDDD